jgi:hypothetical protein
MAGRCDNENCNEPLFEACDACGACGFSGCKICVENGFHASVSSRGHGICRITKERSSIGSDSKERSSIANASVPGVNTPIIATPNNNLAEIFKKNMKSKLSAKSLSTKSFLKVLVLIYKK